MRGYVAVHWVPTLASIQGPVACTGVHSRGSKRHTQLDPRLGHFSEPHGQVVHEVVPALLIYDIMDSITVFQV